MDVDEAVPPTQRLDNVGGGNSQVENNVGGFVWQLDDIKRLRRFLVLGSETPTYYITDEDLGRENALALLSLLREGRGVQAVNEILQFSVEGRTVKQNPIMLSLAICARLGDLQTKRRAYEVVTQVCRIPTHLFMFVKYCEKLSQPSTGWGRAHRNAMKRWYVHRVADPMKMAIDVTKYQKREGWSHKDIARLMHLKTDLPGIPDELKCIMKYIAKGWDAVTQFYFPPDIGVEHFGVGEGTNTVLQFFRAVEDVKLLRSFTPENETRVVGLIEKYGLVREHIPTHFLNSITVWRALLTKMPMTAMIRNLGKMTSVGLLGENSHEATQICSKLQNVELLRRARIHPFKVLVGLKTYMDGHGDRGHLTWTPNETIVQAMEQAFYLSFKNVSPTNKRYLLAIDVSGSMSYVGCAGTPCITPRVASAAMSMVTARTESSHHFVAFSHKILPLVIHPSMSLEKVLLTMEEVPMGGTDCALPMLYAIDNNLEIDVFVVYTDCETKAGEMHPSVALKRYREHSKINDAKLIVVAMTSNGFTIADPNDEGMFDMVGFDAAAPEVMREFILGNI